MPNHRADELAGGRLRNEGQGANTRPPGSDRFLRWAVPAAAAVAIAVGALWWSITLRQEGSPVVHLHDGAAELAISANGRSLAFRELPPALQDAISEAFRTGRIPLSSAAGDANRKELEEAEHFGKGSHLVLGVAKARAGLAAQAVEEFRALREQNPEAALPTRLLEQAEALPSGQK